MNTKEVLKTYITEEILNRQNINLGDEELLVGGGLISSLGVVQLVSFIEEKFGVSVPYEDVTIDNFRDLNALSDYIATLKG